MRAVSFERGVAQKAEGSCLVSFGNTKVRVTASVDHFAPPAQLRNMWYDEFEGVKGDYTLFAHLETVYLGVLTRRTLITTNTARVVEAANGTVTGRSR